MAREGAHVCALAALAGTPEATAGISAGPSARLDSAATADALSRDVVTAGARADTGPAMGRDLDATWRHHSQAPPRNARTRPPLLAAMGIDALAPSITLVNPETGKGRVTYLCEGRPEQLFVPTPGLWFTTQPPEVRVSHAAP